MGYQSLDMGNINMNQFKRLYKEYLTIWVIAWTCPERFSIPSRIRFYYLKKQLSKPEYYPLMGGKIDGDTLPTNI